MSEGDRAGTVNPAFDINDESIADDKQDEADADVQIKGPGETDLDTEERSENRNSFNENNSDGHEVKETVLDILRRSQMKEETGNVNDSKKLRNSETDDVRIAMPGPDVQITRLDGKEFDSGGSSDNGNSLDENKTDEKEVKETVLDILRRSQIEETGNVNDNIKLRDSETDDVRITIPGLDGVENEKVCTDSEANSSVNSEDTLSEQIDSDEESGNQPTAKLRQSKEAHSIASGDGAEVTEVQLRDKTHLDSYFGNSGGKAIDLEENLDNRNTYTVTKNDDNAIKETVLDILLKSQKEEEKNVQQPATLRGSDNKDIRISISEDYNNEKVTDMTPESGLSTSVPTNGTSSKTSVKMQPNKLAQSLNLSLSKAEKPPPLDANGDNSRRKMKAYFSTCQWTDADTKWLAWIELKFKDIAGADGEIDLEEFKKALGLKKSFFAERFFELFDQDRSGAIELGELMDGLRMLTKGTPAQKLQFLFDVYDADASGNIDRDELMAVLRACMEESSLSLTQDNLDDLTDVLFDAADEDESGTITFEELRNELEKHPGVIENLTISAAQWLKPPDSSRKKKSNLRYFTVDYWRNNYRKVGYCLTYWTLNIILYSVAMWQYRDSNTWVMFARGAGLCLNFNCMWVLVLMLRKSLTFLRMTKLVHILPLDQHILLHKMTAWAIAGFAFIHTMAHIGNSAHAANANAMEMSEVLFTAKAGVGYVDGSAFITGWLLDIILTVMVICSLPFVRRKGHFQVFYWTHMLYVPFWILVILHGPHFWKWFIVPGVIFIMEKISRSKLIKMARYGDTYIEEVNLLPSGVTHLVISRPTNFRYKPGDYIFIQIPEIATYEWHPFTISSAPEMEGHIWLHVRSAGHWTNKLYKHFDKLEAPEDPEDMETLVASNRSTRKFEKFERAYSRRPTTRLGKSSRGESKSGQKPKQKHKVVRVKCYVDGPYGTGTREVFDTDHAVLIGAGIGVTPMASILQSVWYRFNAVRQTCPNCEHVWYPDEDTCEMKLRKVDFIWINRDQKSFEWFLTLLNQIEFEQSSHHGILENCIQMHMYMTAAQKKTDMKGIGLQIALDLMYEKSHRDLITGLRTKTEPGRPDWNKIFKAIKSENKGKVKVFFCGAPALGKTVKEVAAKYNFAFSKENF